MKDCFIFALLIALILLSSKVFAVVDVQKFETEEDRLRYLRLVKEYRCPKCQNQNLIDSNSAIAIDLRGQVARLVREKLSDEEINVYMVDRYGDFVLYDPPIQSNTIALWLGPLLMMLIGAFVFVVVLVKRQRSLGQKS